MLIAGNWKLFKGPAETVEFCAELRRQVDPGGVDVVVVNRDGPAYVLRNVVKSRGAWISFRVLEKSGGDALGATVTAMVGGRRIRRDVTSAYSYCVANDPRVHLGLGTETRVTDVRVRWVDGIEEAFGDFEANRNVRLRRGEGSRS